MGGVAPRCVGIAAPELLRKGLAATLRDDLWEPVSWTPADRSPAALLVWSRQEHAYATAQELAGVVGCPIVMIIPEGHHSTRSPLLMSGGSYVRFLCVSISARGLLGHLRELTSDRASADQGGPSLTAREYDVLVLVAQGLTNAEVASVLFISPESVKSHVKSILRKSGQPNRRLASRYFIRQGLLAQRSASDARILVSD